MSGGGGDGPGCPLWVISFADMVANLVIFFILMATFATASSGSAQGGRRPTNGYVGIIGDDRTPNAPKLVKPRQQEGGTPGDEGAEQRSHRQAKEVDEKLAKKVQRADYNVKPDATDLKDGVRISLSESALFAPGSDRPSDHAIDLLGEVARYFEDESCEFIVEAHTDDRTVTFSRFKSPEELTRAVAIRVARLLAEQAKVEPARIGIASMGASHPLDTNETAAGRSKNRRVEIIVGHRL